MARRGRLRGSFGQPTYGFRGTQGFRPYSPHPPVPYGARDAYPQTSLHGGLAPGPELPPAGSYDPSLDAARAAASRGLLDTRQDIGLATDRAGVDYGLGVEGLQRAQTRGNEDLTTQHTRNDTDFARNTALLQRQFNILAGQQQEGRNAALLGGGGGAALQAAQKRQQNRAIEQHGLDVAHSRTNEDIFRAAGRLGEDTQIGIGQLGLGYNRQVTDLGTQGTRATREDTQFGLDTNAQRYFQAAQYGWQPERLRRRLTRARSR